MDAKISEMLKAKKKKPKFVMQDVHKKDKLKPRWRKPRGSDSKIRYKRRGYRGRISVGYKTPKLIFGLNKEGFKPIRVCSIKDLDKIDKESESIVISKRVGDKKRIAIIKKAEEKSITISNIKDTKDYIKRVEDKLKDKKELREKQKLKQAKKEVKKEDLAEKVEKETTEKEKKEEEKKEKDKVLTKRS